MISLRLPTPKLREMVAPMLAVMLLAAAVTAYSLHRYPRMEPLSGDEMHFVPTISLFGHGLSLDVLKHYEEMSGPFPFLVYAWFGRATGSYDVTNLRLLSLAMGWLTVVLWGLLLVWLAPRNWIVLALGMSILMFNPYIWHTSARVVTDMIAQFCLLAAVLGAFLESPLVLALGLAGALLSRIYLVFFAGGLFAYYFLRAVLDREKKAWWMLGATVIAGLPQVALFLLWHGLCPQNEMQRLYLEGSIQYHPDALVMYIAALPIYILPAMLWRWRTFAREKMAWVIGVPFASLFWAFPPGPSPSAVAVNLYEVGAVHRWAVKFAGGSRSGGEVVLFLCFIFGLPVFVWFVRDILARLARKEHGLGLLLDLCVVFFMVVMPFSYLTWEKYLLPVLPLACLRVLLLPESPEAPAER